MDSGYLVAGDINSLNLLVFSTFQKITVGGFVNQLIKKFWPKCYSDFNPIFLKDHNIKKISTFI